MALGAIVISGFLTPGELIVHTRPLCICDSEFGKEGSSDFALMTLRHVSNYNGQFCIRQDRCDIMNLEDNMKTLITGGSGTLGKAILARAKADGWIENAVVMSRDPMKLQQISRMFPEVEVFVGDVCSQEDVYEAMRNCGIVIHAAAMKHIPEGERNPIACQAVNVGGSIVVAQMAIMYGVEHVIGISTDKACHALNAYGASKLTMERIFQSMVGTTDTEFHLVRYGNVLGSTGSVIPVWRKMEAEAGVVHATNPDMTRFWLSPAQAVDLILKALDEPSGTVAVPDIKSMRMGDLAKAILKPETQIIYDGLRPGEKMHEEMIGKEETFYTEKIIDKMIYRLWPFNTTPISDKPTILPYNSANGPFMSIDEIKELIGE